MDNQSILLALNAHPKIGAQTIKRVLAPFENPIALWEASDTERVFKLGDKISSLVSEVKAKYSPERERERLLKLGIGFLTFLDKEYPKQLKEIPDYPAVIYIRGNLKALSSLSLAVVGSRKFTSYGESVTRELTKSAAEAGLCIVSGLALGIDTCAHSEALKQNGQTVGVLGNGLDRVFPVSNYNLAREIVASGGALISEFSPGTPPLKHHFPLRNRIVAGLSAGVLVTEAGADSGALITANLAAEYGREVFAVPGNIHARESLGCNKLIQEGAKLVTTAEDIFIELNIKAKNQEKRAREIIPESPEEKVILTLLENGEKLADEIVRESKMNVVVVNSALTVLLLKGSIIDLGGSLYRRKF